MTYLKNSLQLITIALAGQSAAIVIPGLAELLRRDGFEIRSYASLGESYASGPSAGEEYDDVRACRRYTEAFGPQVSRDDRIQGPKPIQFHFLACSGSRIHDIYKDRTDSDSGGGRGPKPKKSQASQLKDKSPDLVTMSIGGNDVGFCVYRFYQPYSCKGCHWFWFDDCSSDCQAAIDDVNKNIYGDVFARNFNDAIRAIFDNSPNTHLFITGYPEFWNDKTDACDKVSLKFGCPNNWVLPLIKDRRAKMNQLTWNLNDKIQTLIKSQPTEHPITFVDTNPYFNGHRFCEEGRSEPSYRNPDIWFYPFEYSTDNTLSFDIHSLPTGDCADIYEKGGDAGDVYTCDIANALRNGTGNLEYYKQPDNTEGNANINIAEIPDYAARIFHPTKNGMAGYRDAIVDAYKKYRAENSPPPPPGPTKALGIVGDFMKQPKSLEDLTAFNKIDWQFFATDFGKTVDCRTDSAYHEERDIDRSEAGVSWYPGGTFNLRLFDEDCQYKNSGDNPGRLFCGSKEIECKDDLADKNPSDPYAEKGNYDCGDNKIRQPVFTCAY